MAVRRFMSRKLNYRRLLFLLIFGMTVLLTLRVAVQPNIRDMLELHKCPACYGVSLCSDILKGTEEISISLDVWGRLGLVVNTWATKNVISGSLEGRRVIVKRLGQSSELKDMDEKICQTMGYDKNCHAKMKEIVFKVPHLRNQVQSLLNESSNFNNFRLRLCPSTENVDTLFSNILPKTNGTILSKLSNDGFTANIWTMLLINPEPLLLQIMRAEDGWPVPHYLGACGRITVTLNAGEPLTTYHGKSWPERAGLALQLLLAADRFTYSHSQFAFYLLDISSDNIAVSNTGKLTFVDLEHMIVVDRHPHNVPETWNESHVSESYDDCPGCNTFSSQDICQHHTSDHNHFVICQQLLAAGPGSTENLLPNGLLHSMPIQIQENYPKIFKFLKGCSSDRGSDRIRNARRLRDILNIASKESPLFADPSLIPSWKYF